MAALARYKVVILDEVHERSVESDMVLTFVKQLMLRNPKIQYLEFFFFWGSKTESAKIPCMNFTFRLLVLMDFLFKCVGAKR
jgi:hypothetical protein